MNRLNLDVVFQLTSQKSSNTTHQEITVVDYEALEKKINQISKFSEANTIIRKIMEKSR